MGMVEGLAVMEGVNFEGGRIHRSGIDVEALGAAARRWRSWGEAEMSL